MSLKKARAVVLKRLSAREKDLLAEILLDSGERRALRFHGILASKSRSPLLAEPGSLIEINYYEGPGSEISLREGSLVRRFDELKSDYRRQDLLAKILKLSRIAASGEADPSLYRLTESALEYAAANVPADPHAVDAFLVFYVTRILLAMGLLGDPTTCARCGNELQGPGSRAAWGDGAFFLCGDCSPAADEAGAACAGMISRMSQQKYRELRAAVEALDEAAFPLLKNGLQRALQFSLPDPPAIFE